MFFSHEELLNHPPSNTIKVHIMANQPTSPLRTPTQKKLRPYMKSLISLKKKAVTKPCPWRGGVKNALKKPAPLQPLPDAHGVWLQPGAVSLRPNFRASNDDDGKNKKMPRGPKKGGVGKGGGKISRNKKIQKEHIIIYRFI